MEGLLSENIMEDNVGVSLSTEPCNLSKQPSENTDEVEILISSLSEMAMDSDDEY